MLKSLEARRWSAALVSLIALVLSGSYSVTAALDSAAGGRTNAAMSETAATDARAKAQANFTTAKGELDALKPARSVGELEPILAVAKPQCGIVVQRSSRATVCAPPVALVTEFARAKRRLDLTAAMDKASDELRHIQPARVANADAKVLARYLTAVGLAIVGLPSLGALTKCRQTPLHESGPRQSRDREQRRKAFGVVGEIQSSGRGTLWRAD
jgi:hypothetical protein